MAETGQIIDAGGVHTFYDDIGTGAPVVFLHGSGPGVSARSNWSHLYSRFNGGIRLIAPDIAGFGASKAGEGAELNIKLWVGQLIAFLDALGIERATLVGNSFGGGLALATALKHPQRIERLVLMGTPAGDFVQTEGLRSGWFYEPSLENMEAILRLFPFDQSFVTTEMIESRYHSSARPGAQEAFRKLIPKPSDEGDTIVRGVPEAALRTIAHPVLVLHGREDRIIPFEIGLRLAREIPNADLHVFANCGHWVQVERADEFVRLVSEFVVPARSTP